MERKASPEVRSKYPTVVHSEIFFFSDTNLIAQQTEQVRYAEFPRLVRN